MSALIFKDAEQPRRLKKIVINEISVVNKPACEGCRVVLIKRADEREQKMETTQELIRKAGVLVDAALQGQADRLRKREPYLSEAQAFAKVYCDPANVELRRAERTANGFGDYSKRAPSDISEAGQVDFGNGEAKQWAYNEIQRRAVELRKRQPELSDEQAFSRIYCSPESIELRKAEREANGYPATTGWRGPLPPVARTEPLVEQSMALDGLQRLADELRQKNPWLTDAQCFARVLGGPDHLSEGQRQFARRAATLSIQAEAMEADAVGNKPFDVDLYGQLTDRLGRCLQRIGLKRVARDISANAVVEHFKRPPEWTAP